MREVYALVQQVLNTTAAVLITGESGTGNELIARVMHDQGLRRTGPFIAINGAAIPERLWESELFSPEKGAFSGRLRAVGDLLTRT
jgi:DNA-binding NtrC family response regulator